jgi:hypothetical protein
MITIRLRRGTSIQWSTTNPILEAGEQGFATDTGTYKIGDGLHRWSELDSYVPEAAMLIAIEEAVATYVFDSSLSHQELLVHIDSPNPHPIYDDGPSLFLLYQNAKV